MSVTIITNEGNRITGETALDVVSQMNARALLGEPDAWRYMITLAGRVQRLRGSIIRTTSPALFLEDLAAAGFITLDEALAG
jgi:hypothetical protein